jgi:hypothetical protein
LQRNDNAYLQPIVESDDGEDSYFELVDALERLEDGESCRSVAKTLSISRQGSPTFTRIPRGDGGAMTERERERESDDKRVTGALDEVAPENS